MDEDQSAPTGEVWSGSTLFVEEASETFQQTTKQSDRVLCCTYKYAGIIGTDIGYQIS